MTISLLDQLRDDVHAALADDARAATLRHEEPGGLDEYGDPLPGVVTTYDCKGWVEEYDATWLSAGIPSTDVRILILQKSLTGHTPEQDDQLMIESQWYQIRNISRDPANAAWVFQSYAISDPS